ncbi:MAG TPA: UDP-N-acetylglucosamine--N-acetylmuramyl-(pentapeptide) pyrophosphoryl-undecaprenol N-acetylglucosamine transferase, partial [Lachnospiraceae bacterium]|nr:UDP-N-acetylglucosamine--N-acetylmuramyl-(pentapeptide) pyrophosphoryl-undecaprenol N-acetylglucosamine transferase [Lachnospiraceae bacterium]
EAINKAYANRDKYIKTMKQSRMNNSIEKITGLVNEAASRKHK